MRKERTRRAGAQPSGLQSAGKGEHEQPEPDADRKAMLKPESNPAGQRAAAPWAPRLRAVVGHFGAEVGFRCAKGVQVHTEGGPPSMKEVPLAGTSPGQRPAQGGPSAVRSAEGRPLPSGRAVA